MVAIESDSPLAEQLAERICRFPLASITDEAVRLSKLAIIDTIGVTLAGMTEPAVKLLYGLSGLAQAPGQSTVFGCARKTSALDAALINGTSSHALDFDDFSQPFGGHQSAPLVAPLFALAEERGASGRQVIDAYVVGVETEIKIARAVNFVHYEKGWHPTSTLGVFGASAACGYLIGLDQSRMAVALALAASMAAGIKANFGTMTKPLHIGQCARQGLFSALLAERGYSANIGALEHRQGFLDVYNGPGMHDPSAMLAGWAEPLEVLGMDMGLKQFPCCGSTHPAVMVALKIQQAYDLPVDSIRDIVVKTHRRRLPHTNNPNPTSSLEAKFSIQYAVARALVSRHVSLAHFLDDAIFEASVRQLMANMQVMPLDQDADAQGGQFGAEIQLNLKNGRRIVDSLDSTVGRGRSNPMSDAEMWEKFGHCAQILIPEDNARAAFRLMGSLETIDDITRITALFTSGTDTDQLREISAF
ncbi:MmgE/PrpD family protein [Castellaniella sp.]